METYTLSKTSVLKLLKANGVTMRRQPLTDEQLQQTAKLYNTGRSLAAIESELNIPKESIRRALIEEGIKLRPRGGSKAKSGATTRL
jgi:hypothetical protein